MLHVHVRSLIPRPRPRFYRAAVPVEKNLDRGLGTRLEVIHVSVWVLDRVMPTLCHTAHSYTYFIRLEGIPKLLNDGFVGRGVRGGVKHKDRVEDEGVSLILIVVNNTLGAAHNSVPRHIPTERPSHIIDASKTHLQKCPTLVSYTEWVFLNNPQASK